MTYRRTCKSFERRKDGNCERARGEEQDEEEREMEMKDNLIDPSSFFLCYIASNGLTFTLKRKSNL